MGILLEALKGAGAELGECRTWPERAARAARIAHLFAAELAGMAGQVPYGLRAYATRASLPRLQPGAAAAQALTRVHLAEDVSYGPAPREVLDLYLPPSRPARIPAASADGPDTGADRGGGGRGEGAPVVLFCHGGVWASGDKWHYTPLATALAQLGILTGVLHYTLYPQARVPQQVSEVSRALTWTLANAPAYGGDPAKVAVVGHSAGAHLFALALLQRAQQARRAQRSRPQRAGTKGAGDDSSGVAANGCHSEAQHSSTAQPRLFVGLAGCYNIGAHYAYEQGRGVARLSTMERAMGGREHFDALSPALALAGSLASAAQHAPSQGAQPAPTAQQARRARSAALVEGQQAGTAPGIALGAATAAADQAPEALAEGLRGDRSGCGARDYGPDSPPGGASRLTERLALPPRLLARVQDGPAESLTPRFPPTVLMSSPADVTVPWYESAEFFWRLRECGVPAKHLVYPALGHGAYATQWWPGKGGAAQAGPGQELEGFARDFVAAVKHPERVAFDAVASEG